MSEASGERANPFDDLGDFAPKTATKPAVAPGAIDELAETSGFPSRKPRQAAKDEGRGEARPGLSARIPRRHTTGRNRQINIKATEETIAALYRIADERGLPLGAVLELALASLENDVSEQ